MSIDKPATPAGTNQDQSSNGGADKKPKVSQAGMTQLAKSVRTEKTAVMDPVENKQLKAIARDLIVSEAVPSCFKTADQVFMALLAGHEMGMKPVESMSSFYIVNGRLKIWGNAVPRRLREHGWRFQVIEEDDTHCVMKVWKGTDGQDGYEKFEEDFKYADAEASGYTKDNHGTKVGWRPGINRRKKMRYGALSVVIDTYIPQVLGSVDGIVEMSQDYGENPPPAEAVELRRRAVVDKKSEAVEVKKHEDPSDD